MPDFVGKCEQLGVRYVNIMPPEEDLASGQGRGWHKTLNAANRRQAEAHLRGLGYGWSWPWRQFPACSQPGPSGSAKPARRQARVLQPAYRRLARLERQSQMKPSNRSFFGDHSEIPAAAMQVVAETAEEMTVDLQWRSGDMVMVDNMQVMHGRRPFQRPPLCARFARGVIAGFGNVDSR